LSKSGEKESTKGKDKKGYDFKNKRMGEAGEGKIQKKAVLGRAKKNKKVSGA